MGTFWEQYGLYGIMAEFTGLRDAAGRRETGATPAGYRKMDAYAPMPVEGLADAIGFRKHWVRRRCWPPALRAAAAASA